MNTLTVCCYDFWQVDADYFCGQGVQDDELELDIDELSDEVLHKLWLFTRKHVPRTEDSPPRKAAPTAQNAAPSRKKNKPMSKTEQEARIKQVKGNLSAFQNPGLEERNESGKFSCSAPLPDRSTLILEIGNATLQANDTSGDEEASEESEEE